MPHIFGAGVCAVGLLSLLFSFNGRVSRSQYWLGTIGVNLVNWIVMAGSSMTTAFTAADKNPVATLSALSSQNAVLIPLSLAVTWIALALQVKRFHDRGQSGWWTLLPLAPVAFVVMNVFSAMSEQWPAERLLGSMGLPLLALLVISLGFFINLGCLAGTDGPNKFGDPPGSGGSFKPSAPTAPTGNVVANSSLFGAQSAIDRAVAERTQQRPAAAVRSRTAAPAPAMAPAPSGGFGRRPAR